MRWSSPADLVTYIFANISETSKKKKDIAAVYCYEERLNALNTKLNAVVLGPEKVEVRY